MTNKRISLKFKLAFFASLLVIFVAFSLSTFIRQGQKKAILEGQEVSRMETVKALRQVARESILMDDDTSMVNYVNLLAKSLTTAYAMVLDPDGRIRVHTDPTLIGKKLNDPAALAALAGQLHNESVSQNLLVDGRHIIDISLPIVLGTNPVIVKGVARIGFDKSIIDRDIAQSLQAIDRQIKAAFFLALMIGIIGALLLATLITRPIETLRKGAQQIGEGKLNHRITVSTKDELRELADEFNLMAQKLGELDQMKQDFVSNVTHELRSPMTSIRGYIDLLLQGAAGSLSDLQKDYLSIIKNSAVRLGRFIDNLLDVAKIEAHKLKLTPERLDLYPLAREMEVLFKPQLDEKHLKFSNLVPADLSPALADKDKMAEVMINLASNAIKFTPEQGTIQVSAAERANFIEVTVQDTGVGIPADMIGKMFSKFEQVKSNQGHARKHKGTGLGLAITKGIIEAHGGKIWIKSPAANGKGTAFVFTIPKITEQMKADQAAASNS